MSFTHASLKSLRPKAKRYVVRDGKTRKGFAVRVSPAGAKAFIFIYDYQKKRRWMILGTFPDMPLAEAHLKYAEAKKLLGEGRDPQAVQAEAVEGEKREKITEPDMARLAALYIERHAERFKRSWKEDRRILTKDVLPAWGNRQAREIKRAEIIELIEGVGKRGPVMANRTRAVLSRMFRFGFEQGLLDSNPADGVRDPFKETPRKRSLSADEIKIFWKALDDTVRIRDGVRTALRVVLLTGQRPGEVAGMNWGEVGGHWWTIPPARSKTGKPQRVFLHDIVLGLLQGSGEGHVFPSKKGMSLRPRSLSQALKRLEYFGLDPFKPHDLRRTCISHMAELGIPPHVLDYVLGHNAPSDQRMLAIYNRYDYDPEKKTALTRWAFELGRIVGWNEPEPNVIPFERKSSV